MDNIITRIDVLEDSYRKERNIPARAFEVYEEQREGLIALKEEYGSVVSVEKLIMGVQKKDLIRSFG